MIGNDDRAIRVSCGCITITLLPLLVLLAWVTIDGCYSSYQKRRQVRETKEFIEKKKTQQEVFREKTLREFSVAESPMLWKSIQELKGEIAVQCEKINLLRNAIEKIGRDPSVDEDYKALYEDYCLMTNRLLDVERSLENAYLSSIKYQVSRPVASKNEFERKISNDGISKIIQLQTKYDDLRNEK